MTASAILLAIAGGISGFVFSALMPHVLALARRKAPVKRRERLGLPAFLLIVMWGPIFTLRVTGIIDWPVRHFGLIYPIAFGCGGLVGYWAIGLLSDTTKTHAQVDPVA